MNLCHWHAVSASQEVQLLNANKITTAIFLLKWQNAQIVLPRKVKHQTITLLKRSSYIYFLTLSLSTHNFCQKFKQAMLGRKEKAYIGAF